MLSTCLTDVEVNLDCLAKVVFLRYLLWKATLPSLSILSSVQLTLKE